MDDGSIAVTVDGKALVCAACGNDRYRERGSLLNTRGGEFFGFAWANQKATNFICTKCGYIHWFLRLMTHPIPLPGAIPIQSRSGV